jgi:hypothetical protein
MSYYYKSDAELAKELAKLYEKEEKQRAEDERLALKLMHEFESHQNNDIDLALALSLTGLEEKQSKPTMKSVNYRKDAIEFCCPHCPTRIIVMNNEFNCRIFRCGQYMDKNGEMLQVPQHAKWAEVEAFKKTSKRFFGCGNPFCLQGEVDQKNVVVAKADWSS